MDARFRCLTRLSDVHPITVLVLAGGKSRRMGTNKALLRLPTGETLIERVLANLSPLSNDLLVASNSPELYADLPARHAMDEHPGAGPLAGLEAGLRAARHDWTLAVACDMPLVNHRLIRYMAVLTEGNDAVAPVVGGEIEPLHALYHRSCLPAIAAHLEAGRRRVVSFFGDVRVRQVEPAEIALFDVDGRSFFNANTPEDWQRLLALLSKEPRQSADANGN